MAQWLSQTRKMNRHYQSTKKNDEIFFDFFQSFSVYFDTKNDPDTGPGSDGSIIVGGGGSNPLSISGMMNYYDNGDWKWEDHVNFTLDYKITPVDLLENISFTIPPEKWPEATPKIVQAKRVVYSASKFNKEEECIDFTTTPILEKPFTDVFDKIEIIISDPFKDTPEGLEVRCYGAYLYYKSISPYYYINYMGNKWAYEERYPAN